METVLYCITHTTLLACLGSLIYVIAFPAKKLKDNSDIW